MWSAQLRWTDSERQLRVLELDGEGRSVLVGRGGGCTVDLSHDVGVSRPHARLFEVDGHWLVEDVGSAGGTYVLVGGTPYRLFGPRALRDGDSIRVGESVLSFRRWPLDDDPSTVDERATVPVGPRPDPLTEKEQEVLWLLSEPALRRTGPFRTNAEIAREMFTTEGTVRTHLKSIYRKFGLEGADDAIKRAELVRLAVELRVVRLE